MCDKEIQFFVVEENGLLAVPFGEIIGDLVFFGDAGFEFFHSGVVGNGLKKLEGEI